MTPPLVTWAFPTAVVFGAGAVSTVATHIKRIGAKRALVVCDPGVVKAGIAERVRSLLEAGAVAAVVFDTVDPNPVETNIADGVAAYRAHDAAWLVAGGGGAPPYEGPLIAHHRTPPPPTPPYHIHAPLCYHHSVNTP